MKDPISVTIATTLRTEVEHMIQDDPKMVGIAKYLASVEIFWSYQIETACAGHGFIFFNPDWWDSLPEQTRITVIAHEVWHLILKHLERGILFDPWLYNIAGDHVINNLLFIDGFTFEGWNCLRDPDYKDLSTEEVYNIVLEERNKDPVPPKPPFENDPPKEDKPPQHVPRSTIEELIKVAADLIAGNDHYNNVPKQIDKDQEELKDQSISLGDQTGYDHLELEITGRKIAIKDTTYEEIFADYLTDPMSAGKRSFLRPNRRQHGTSGFILPGRTKRKAKSNRLAHLIYALDVSGSITPQTAQIFHDSVRTIKKLLNPNLLTVLFFDTELKLIKTFKANEDYGKITVKAGGCTCLDPVYAYALNRNTDAMVIFTDLKVDIPPEPTWHTIWLVPENHRESTVAELYGDVYMIPKP